MNHKLADTTLEIRKEALKLINDMLGSGSTRSIFG